ncbi:MAG: FKBP-type peptidyl-prolyl cis-trans isomerase [Bacteroidales bacterium]|nr:FKBP-type peptidyl-prolyl cis-trans isomerase [Bacteroidales bacterium]MCM1146481.1 FKBP-type peptidyl-prolyl cis-trans isomerase [Bacteroidales bacterium]MCM1205081.1 FKBP-type peptidyl-prolyl cis-trans isomerase [Bacillota bacterium]MCM1509327.1 FKBP-type peptidyl-prolyl cis-trans isomerase [Clostridium sp.]
MKKIIYFMAFVAVSLLSSCSETEDEATEFADWQNRNEAYFITKYADILAQKAAGVTTVDTVRCYSKNPMTKNPTDFIVIEKLTDGTGTVSPVQTDSVRIHYRGYLIPSESYQTTLDDGTVVGYQFDSSWTGGYDLSLMNPYVGKTGNFIDGFTTALLNMHDGDRWRVYIPHQLGYGGSTSGSIPAFSTLVFDITLVKHWQPTLN